MKIVIQKIMVPHSKVAGKQTFRDYGLANIFIYDDDDDFMMGGMVGSGDNETNQEGITKYGASFADDYSEFSPIYVDEAEYNNLMLGGNCWLLDN